jgi:predicted Zn-dependent peptidase
MKELRKFKEKPLEEEEVEKAKDQLKGNILLSFESTDNRMSRLAKGELYFNRFIPLEEILDGIRNVSAEDIQRLALELLQESTFSLVALGKVKEKEFTPELLAL